MRYNSVNTHLELFSEKGISFGLTVWRGNGKTGITVIEIRKSSGRRGYLPFLRSDGAVNSLAGVSPSVPPRAPDFQSEDMI